MAVLDIANQIQEALTSCPFRLLECRNVSASHAGHAGHHGNSHFELTFEGELKSHKEMMDAHKAVYHSLRSLYPSQIHSIVLFFRRGLE